jgi:hypothetical protein
LLQASFLYLGIYLGNAYPASTLMTDVVKTINAHWKSFEVLIAGWNRAAATCYYGIAILADVNPTSA